MNTTKKERVFYACVSILSFLCVWQLAVTFTTLKNVLPPPMGVLVAFVCGLYTPIGKHTLVAHTAYSLKRVFVGYGLSSVLGVILGVAMGTSKMINAIVRPIFNLIRPIPGIAWIPMAILWFGIGDSAKYFIIFMGGFANVLLNSFAGASTVDSTFVGAAKLLGANQVQMLFNVTIPSATPYIFAGLQVSLSTSWMAVLAAEMISSYEGAGWIINMGMQTGNTTQILVGMIAIAIIGFIFANGMRSLERRLCSWAIQGQ